MNGKLNRLSVGIPSASRLKYLLRNISLISVANCISEILVVNDGYDENLLDEQIIGLNLLVPVRIVKSKSPGGFSLSFITLIECASAEYIVFMTDDDNLDIAFLNSVSKIINQRTAAIITSGWKANNGSQIRPTSLYTKNLNFDEILKNLAHAPGIVYNVGYSKEFINELEKIVNFGNSFASTYPQVILGAILYSNGMKIMGTSLIAGSDGKEALPSGIVGSDGSKYNSKTSRLEQLRSIEMLLDRKKIDNVLIDQRVLLNLRSNILGRYLFEIPLKDFLRAVKFWLKRSFVVHSINYIKIISRIIK